MASEVSCYVLRIDQSTLEISREAVKGHLESVTNTSGSPCMILMLPCLQSWQDMVGRRHLLPI
jgi:hypothetical protein